MPLVLMGGFHSKVKPQTPLKSLKPKPGFNFLPTLNNIHGITTHNNNFAEGGSKEISGGSNPLIRLDFLASKSNHRIP